LDLILLLHLHLVAWRVREKRFSPYFFPKPLNSWPHLDGPHRPRRDDRNWDKAGRRLYIPQPIDWPYLQAFQQIVTVASDEYGIRLRLTPTTIWSNVSEELKNVIQGNAATCVLRITDDN
jgi:hypothetical protein